MSVRISNMDTQKPVLWLYGVIGGRLGGIAPEDMRDALATVGDQPIELRIHSEGGDYLDAIAIHQNLSRHKAGVSVVVDGLAASAGSIIAMAGESIEMAEGAYMMIHEARGDIRGATAGDLETSAERMRNTNSLIVQAYMRRWKGTEEELREAMRVETWMDAKEAMSRGLADSVSQAMAMAAHVDGEKFHYNKVPEPLIEAKESTIDQLPHLKRQQAVIDELFPEENEECATK